MGGPNHVVAGSDLLVGPLRTQTDDNERSPDLVVEPGPVLVHPRDRGGHFCFRVAHYSSRTTYGPYWAS